MSISYALEFLTDFAGFLISAPILPFVGLFIVAFAFSIVRAVIGR